MENETPASSRTATRPIVQADIGRRTEDLDLALVFDPETRTYFRR